MIEGGNPGAVDLVDIPMGLPDFVQDHLIAEAHGESNQSNPPHSQQPLDLAVLHEVLPNFTSSQNSRTHHYGIHLEDLGAHAVSPSSQNQTSSLPDFLSDGPMYYDASNIDSISNENRGSASGISNHCSPRGASAETRSEAHLRASSFDSDSLTTQVERLRRELIEKSRRYNHKR